MDYNAFIGILAKFADSPSNIDNSRGKILCEIRDEAIEISTRTLDGELLVTENSEEISATRWLLNRVARMPMLADRILSAFVEPEYFICPDGFLINQLDDNSNVQTPKCGQVDRLTIEIASLRPGGCTNVIYLTSDAGEGKTTLIAHLARTQAQKYKNKETDWLLVPIPLGGKPFIRFDDLVVGFLGNQLRFPIFYYEAFMELVKMGVIVPAFDGFEEMFIQSPQGDALSAIGNLMGELNSCGTVLIAARKAYFEYQDIRTQARLFDSIGTHSVAFSKVQINRWTKSNFIDYSIKRRINQGAEIYSKVSERLGENHPILTRAVLVRRLLDVASETVTMDALLQQIGGTPNNYFGVFVSTIIQREANEKWINRIGEPHEPLLTISDHFELLALVAQEMWSLSSDYLKSDVLDLITELFCEAKKLSPDISHQIKERTKQHALIVGRSGSRNTFSFDHDEFRNFFLGIAIARACISTGANQPVELLALFRRGSLPQEAIEAALSEISKLSGSDVEKIIKLLQSVQRMDGPMSFTQENVAKLVIRIINGHAFKPVEFSGLNFGSDVLRDLSLQNISFKSCSFGPTSLENTTLKNCGFFQSRFERIELYSSTKIDGAIMQECDIISVSTTQNNGDDNIFEPGKIFATLQRAGFSIKFTAQQELQFQEVVEDMNLRLFRRLLRTFQTRTYINEHVVLRKLGDGAETFVKDEIPRLVKAGILQQDWIARDKQHKYHLGTSMELLQSSLRHSAATLDDYINIVKKGRT